MTLRFRKSFGIGPGLRLTLSPRGPRLRVGSRNAGLSFGATGPRATASLPNTGLSASTGLGWLGRLWRR